MTCSRRCAQANPFYESLPRLSEQPEHPREQERDQFQADRLPGRLPATRLIRQKGNPSNPMGLPSLLHLRSATPCFFLHYRRFRDANAPAFAVATSPLRLHEDSHAGFVATPPRHILSMMPARVHVHLHCLSGSHWEIDEHDGLDRNSCSNRVYITDVDPARNSALKQVGRRLVCR